MNYLLARTNNQLGICIRMLNDEGFDELMIKSVKNAAAHRMEVRVYINVSAEQFAKLEARYQTLIM